jgi:hypothetical protein
MFGRTVSGFGSKAKRGAAALSGSITLNAPGSGTLTIATAGPGTSATSGSGAIDVTAAGAGGTPGYTYAWAVTEIGGGDDDNTGSGNYVIAAAGTQNAAQYNTLTLTGAFPGPPNPPANPTTYRLTCTITDAATTSVVVVQDITIVVL